MAVGQNGFVSRQLRTLFNVGTIGQLTDGQLLERFATRDGEAAELAFAALVERHGPMVLRVCRGVLRDPHEAQDAFQATFLVLVKKARSLSVRDSLGPWLHQVAYRTASCARAAAARRRRHERRAAERTRCPASGGAGVGDHWEPVLHDEIDRLPERYRVPVVLCDLEGRTHEQAARHLGWPVGTVKSRLTRGRERLRDRLTRRGLAPTIGALGATLSAAAASAAIPTAMAESTIQAAMQFEAGKTTAGVVSASVASLINRELRTMLMTRLKIIAASLLLIGGVATGAGVLAQQEAVESRGPRQAGVAVGKQGGAERAIAAEGKTEGSAAGTKAWTIEEKNGVHVRFDGPAAMPKKLTIRGVPGDRVRIEWDGELAIEGHTFVLRSPEQPRAGEFLRTIIEGISYPGVERIVAGRSSPAVLVVIEGSPDGEVKLIMVDGKRGDGEGGRKTFRAEKFTLRVE